LLQKAWQYLEFLKNSKNRHGVHSPFVFDFIENVLKKKPRINKAIESLRKSLQNNQKFIHIMDLGMGKDRKRRISNIATTSLKNNKEARLISRILCYYQITKAIELGSSLGITTAYMAVSNPEITIDSIEGSEQILTVAQKNWEELGLTNITGHLGNFDDALPQLIQNNKKTLYFIDGNHHEQATIKYFEMIIDQITEESIIIFDDIHWSKSMENAWQRIIKDQRVPLSIDLFEMGIVFYLPRLKKEHFILRY